MTTILQAQKNEEIALAEQQQANINLASAYAALSSAKSSGNAATIQIAQDNLNAVAATVQVANAKLVKSKADLKSAMQTNAAENLSALVVEIETIKAFQSNSASTTSTPAAVSTIKEIQAAQAAVREQIPLAKASAPQPTSGPANNGFWQQALNSLISHNNLVSWNHASKIFGSNNYARAPKSSYLFYVLFDFNPLVIQNNMFNGMYQNQKEIGMLVKQVGLPKFKIETKKYNAYNRPHIIQSKIDYDPITITFHDDSANIIRNFWYDYYTYYYRSSDYATTNAGGNSTSIDKTAMNSMHTEMFRPRDSKYADWGYTIRNSVNGIPTNTIMPNPPPYINNIYIYSLHNKQFSEYAIINPIISSFGHGEHNASEGSGTLSHTMTIEYESISYGMGTVSDVNGKSVIDGFAQGPNYDKTPSPLTVAGGGGGTLFGTGGLGAAIGGLSTSGTAGVLGLAKVANNLKGANLGNMAKTEATNIAKSILSGGANPFASVSVPQVGTLATGQGIPLSSGGSVASANAKASDFVNQFPNGQTEQSVTEELAKSGAWGEGT
jgi:hypothetical protein